ncbi:hypothetical protein VPFG_00241 [Vibrio phage nt-1]|uniref:Uncharacterized protein n=1 Tax=Vibrio phage nt-1 TaxID=115992 RepID=R9TIN1_9CAUD|nr:hypothetical protein VPFG_00241 [Vibrio phage nt-1]AGN30240.1 hypothetical protein VPFG_00241 [Vibrio phage nt-1]
MKDYNRTLVGINYKSGIKVAFWVYNMKVRSRGSSYERINWSSATPPVDPHMQERLKHISKHVLIGEPPISLAGDINDIESVWNLYSYEGEDGKKPEEEDEI